MSRHIFVVETCTIYFSLLKRCGPPNDIISFVGPRLKKFADRGVMVRGLDTTPIGSVRDGQIDPLWYENASN